MKISLRHKLTILFSILIASILLFVYFYIDTSLKNDTRARVEANLRTYLNVSKSYLEMSYIKPDIVHLDQIADLLAEDLGIRVTVIGINGTVLGDSDLSHEQIENTENHLYRKEVQGALKTGVAQAQRFSSTVNKQMLYMAALFGRESPAGVVRVAVPLSDVERVSSNLKRILFMALLLAFVLSTFLNIIISTYVSRPLKNIALITREIAKGNYTKKVEITTNDEIADLGQAINFMVEQMKGQVDEISFNKSRLEAVLLSMFEGVVVIDQRGCILLMNATLRKFLNVADNPVGKKPIEVVRNVEVQSVVDAVLVRKKDVEIREISVFLGEEKIFQIYASPIVRGAEVDGAVLVFHDITELHRLENIRKDFVANVSHELRTPITNIKGYAETLIDGALDDKAHAKEFLEIIYADSNRLTQLVDDLLDLSRIESGKMELAFVPVSLAAVINNVSLALKRLLIEKNIGLSVDIPQNFPLIPADEKSLSQVFFNIFENAIKYNKQGGKISVVAIDQGESVKVSVSDTGIGIPQEDIPRVFERFYRVDKARSRQLGGTGLGLSIAKHIIQSHYGEIFAESKLGEGATFTIILPKS